MNKKITTDMIKHLSMVAKLELNEKQQLEAKTDIENMLEQMDILKELDVDHIEPMTHNLLLQNVFREDIIKNDNAKASILQNAPKQQDGQFKVPKIVD